MSNFPLPKINTAYILYRGLVSQADTKLLKANPTLALGDFKVSIDGGAFTNLGTTPTVTPAAGTSVKISLSAGEMNGDNIVVACIDASGAEWCDQLINIQTATRGIDDLAFPATSGRSMVVDASGLVDANMVKAGPTGAGAAITAGAIPAAVAGAANGLLIAGTNAPVTITGSGDALTLTSTGGNGTGLNATGNGTGEGIKGTGGATGNGIEGVGGATSGAGIKATATAGNSTGLQADGQGSGDGIKATGGATGNGLETIGGATSGDGQKSTVTSGVPIRGDMTGNITGNLSGSVNSVTTAVAVTSNIKKNQALAGFTFVMVLAADHITPATGLTVVVQRSINGGAFANATNTPATEISGGAYSIDLSAADLNGNDILYKMTAATADTRFIAVVTQP